MCQKTSFVLLNDKQMSLALGNLARELHIRPSELIGWTEEEDMMARLTFDMDIINRSIKEENKRIKHGRR